MLAELLYILSVDDAPRTGWGKAGEAVTGFTHLRLSASRSNISSSCLASVSETCPPGSPAASLRISSILACSSFACLISSSMTNRRDADKERMHFIHDVLVRVPAHFVCCRLLTDEFKEIVQQWHYGRECRLIGLLAARVNSRHHIASLNDSAEWSQANAKSRHTQVADCGFYPFIRHC